MSEKVWHYAQNDQQMGPVSFDELKQLAVARQLSPIDLVWKEGETDWVPAKKVSGLFATSRTSPPKIDTEERNNFENVENQHSRFGIASLIVSVSALMGYFLSFLISVVEKNTIVAVIFLGFLGVNVVGVGLGIAGLTLTDRIKTFSVVGIVINGVMLIGFLLFLVVCS